MADPENPISAAIETVIGLFSGGPVAWPPAPELIEVKPEPSDAANRADAAMNADAADPTAATTIWKDYNDAYGWTKDAPSGRRKSHPSMPTGDPPFIQRPWTLFDVHDLDAAIQISGLLEGAKPEHVLALAMIEGVVIATEARTHGTKVALTATDPIQALTEQVTADQLRAWTRSLYIWNILGGDEYTSHGTDEADHATYGPEEDHDGAFLTALQDLRAGAPANGLAGPIVAGDLDAIVSYTKNSWLKLDLVNVTTGTVVDINDVKTMPAGAVLVPRVLARDWSLGSWLYLEFSLFYCKYRLTMEGLFHDKFGEAVDLSDQPWVTYTGWNGDAKTQVDWLFTNGTTPQEAIDHVFGDPPLTLTQAERDLFFMHARDPAIAHCNAAIVKYLCEVMARWFV